MPKAAASQREEIANARLADALTALLGEKFVVKAETSGRADRKLPDIVVSRNGTQIVLEAKIDDFKAAAAAAEARFQNMNPPPDIVGAVSYSPPFRANPEAAMRKDAPIVFALRGKNSPSIAKRAVRKGVVYDLAQALRRPQAILSPDNDEVAQAVAKIRGTVALFVARAGGNRGALSRWSKTLQASFRDAQKEEVLRQTAHVAGLILFGAILFQFALSQKNKNVKNPAGMIQRGDGTWQFGEHWKLILDEINYAAIFRVAWNILIDGVTKEMLRELIQTADEVREIADGSVDLMGRIYHTLLADAKPLGAFFTSIPAATMMASLALAPRKGEKWGDLEWTRKLRIVDPACGSGTLLAAACWKIRDNYSRARFRKEGARLFGENKKNANSLDAVQRALIEDGVWGYDILSTAGHLTATTLGMMSPDVDFRKAHIYRAMIGDDGATTLAGSLELLLNNYQLFSFDSQVETEARSEVLPLLDLCILNPPFVRGSKGHESFSFLPPKTQKAVQERMRYIGRRCGFSTDKGQGPGFVTLATSQIRSNGRVALILPINFALGGGKAWSNSRARIEGRLNLETLVASWDVSRPNFSENTNLQECIAVARGFGKKADVRKNALFVSFRKNPTNESEAMAAARAIETAHGGDFRGGFLLSDGGIESADATAENIVGQFAFMPYRGKSAWRGIQFANLELALAANDFIESGSLRSFSTKGKIPFVQLGDLADFGGTTLDILINTKDVEKRRVRISRTPTAYAGYYPGYHHRHAGVSHRDMSQISEAPQCWLTPLRGHEGWAEKFFAKAGRVVVNHSFRFNTARRLAALISNPVQAAHYWPIRLRNQSESKLKALTLWLNSSPALLLIAHFSQPTHLANVQLGQAAARELPTPDLENLSRSQLGILARAFDSVVGSDGLLPLPQMESDPARKKIDDAVERAFGLGDLAPLRAALANEPIITNRAPR